MKLYDKVALVTGSAKPIGPSFNFAVKEAGFRELVSFLKEDFVELQGSMLVHERIFQSDPALVEKFVRETLKGLRFARKQSRHDSDLTPLSEDQRRSRRTILRSSSAHHDHRRNRKRRSTEKIPRPGGQLFLHPKSRRPRKRFLTIRWRAGSMPISRPRGGKPGR